MMILTIIMIARAMIAAGVASPDLRLETSSSTWKCNFKLKVSPPRRRDGDSEAEPEVVPVTVFRQLLDIT
jgi:hypothetical protein